MVHESEIGRHRADNVVAEVQLRHLAALSEALVHLLQRVVTGV